MQVTPLFAVLLATGPASVGADAGEESPTVAFSLGIKTGFIPPVLAAPELVVHGAHFLIGAFGMYGGAGRWTIGGELGLELSPPGQSTFYVLGTLFHYAEAPNASGSYERSDEATLTGGYEWKWARFELQLGAGALFILRDETPPCSGWFCGFKPIPPVLPTFDLSARYRF